MPPPLDAGQLYVVGTPIGNLSDMTPRALEILQRTPQLAAEDTRRTRTLLSHFEITGKKLHRLDAYASPGMIERLLTILEAGQDLALVTDAGMPGVSDPGAHLVTAAHARGLRVTPIPGPSAVTTAIAASGLVQGPFLFFGFLPRHGSKKTVALTRLASTAEAVVIFEAPQRLADTLAALAALTPNRTATVCRELTKLHEEIITGSLIELAAREHWRGEITVVLGPHANPSIPISPSSPGDTDTLGQDIRQRLNSGETPRSIVLALATKTTLRRRELYTLIQQLNGR